MGGKEKKEMILVQVQRGEGSEYFIVDLGADKVRRTPVATLLYGACSRSTLCSGHVLYALGGGMEADDELPPTVDGNHHIHLGTSCLELNVPHLSSLLEAEGEVDDNDNDAANFKWKATPLMQLFRTLTLPYCASLGGRVYALGESRQTSVIGEVFIPSLGKWEPLDSPPSNPSGKPDDVSYPVIPDEKNERLLVHFRDVSSLFAYYPSTGKWDCLANNFWRWNATTALVDGVLYFHIRGTRDCIAAYDLLTNAWLNVEYSTEFAVNICISEFLDMLYLGNGMLCLANFCAIFDVGTPVRSLKTNLQFVKFRVERTSPRDVLVTPISPHRFSFEGHLNAIQFILL